MWNVFFFIIITSFFATLTTLTTPALHPDELHALEEIATTLGIKRVNLSYKDPCDSQSLMIIKQADRNLEVNNTIACDCSFNNNMTCHITELSLVNLTLVGKVPPELNNNCSLLNKCSMYNTPLLSSATTVTLLCTSRLGDDQDPKLHALEEIATTLGIKRVNLSYKDPCDSQSLMIIKQADRNLEVNNTIACDCSFNNNMTCHITELSLVNLTLVGKVPPELAKLRHLRSIDLSANYLTGTIPPEWLALRESFVWEFTNLVAKLQESEILVLSLNLPSCQLIFFSVLYRDLSYNNFSWSSSCQEKRTGLLPCAGPVNCKTYQRSVHINCGGEDIKITNSFGKITYQADNSKTNAATNHHLENWGISNTAYNVKLHFMEIQFPEKEVYSRIGRRIFDVYVQGKLFLRDFNIKEEANGTLKPVVKELKANVTDHLLEIRLYWAGKGTALIPNRGNYGPLISAISLCHSKNPYYLLSAAATLLLHIDFSSL
ncbi:hypothetical protein F2Q69_00008350 [Brassica cretica]|uniref:non-specific serine/threonine protein kinase n=1 Tax=Brassica cretica TaxID=69181 RepID=A0A8S9PGF7_BRACR|nr:hypothetical protein F2Q69_00008350 [Brassica cretica]